MLVEVDDTDAVLALAAEVLERRANGWAPGLLDVVPAARTLLLDGVDPAAVANEIPTWELSPPPTVGSSAIEIGCHYDGPDLAEVARQWRTSVAEVVRIHTSAVHTVAFCGFAPGFAYLTGIGEERTVARRPSPRTAVPAGSVAVAGVYTGIYPQRSPGGWQLIGRTDVQTWDPSAEPPALLSPGVRVRFVDLAAPAPAGTAPAPEPPAEPDARTTVTYGGATHTKPPAPQTPAPPAEPDARTTVTYGGAARTKPPAPQPPAPQPGSRSATVTRPGALTTVQDGGRPGLAHLGVPRAGALDAAAHHLANRLVGNAPGAPVLETTLDGVGLRFESDATVAVTGAPAPVTVDAAPADWGLVLFVPAGAVLDVGPATAGVRSYVAVGGGFEVPLVLGSASADLLSGLGPAPLAAGDLLGLGEVSSSAPVVDLAPYPRPGDEIELAVRLGPRDDWLSDAGIATLRGGSWTVSPDSNRIALRLTGPAVERSRHDELPSEGLALGAVQSLPDGQLVIFLADHPTTGGYPVVAVVDRAALDACAQARPGTSVRFRQLR